MEYTEYEYQILHKALVLYHNKYWEFYNFSILKHSKKSNGKSFTKEEIEGIREKIANIELVQEKLEKEM